MAQTAGWEPGQMLLASRVGKTLPGGYTVQYKEGLLIPYYFDNAQGGRTAMGREAGFAFPLAAAGFLVGGFLGVFAGHILGATVGLVREARIRGSVPEWGR